VVFKLVVGDNMKKYFNKMSTDALLQQFCGLQDIVSVQGNKVSLEPPIDGIHPYFKGER